jgi:hypothetical protein
MILANELPEIPAPITATLNDSNAREVPGELSDEPDAILSVGKLNPSKFKNEARSKHDSKSNFIRPCMSRLPGHVTLAAVACNSPGL